MLRNRQQTGQLGGVARHLHAAPAAARAGLDQHRIADRADRRLGCRDIRHAIRRTGHRRDPEPARGLLCRDLVAHQPDMLGRGADESEPVLLHRRSEIGVLREKTETGMDRIGAGDRRGREDRCDIQIAVARRRRADAHGLVGQPHIHRIGVRGRMHRHRLDPHFPTSAMNAQRNLPAIGDQHFVEHRLNALSAL